MPHLSPTSWWLLMAPLLWIIMLNMMINYWWMPKQPTMYMLKTKNYSFCNWNWS